MEGSMNTKTAGPEGGGQAGTATTTVTTPTATGQPATGTPTGAPGGTQTVVTEAATPDPTTRLLQDIQTELAESRKLNGQALDRIKVLEEAKAATEAENRRLVAVDAVRKLAEAEVATAQLPAPMHPRVIDTVTVDVPLTEAGLLDEEEAGKRITAAIERERAYGAQLAESLGAGTPRSLVGAPPAPRQEEDIDKALEEALRDLPGFTKAATAAKGA
jgi:hypothetical protein